MNRLVCAWPIAYITHHRMVKRMPRYRYDVVIRFQSQRRRVMSFPREVAPIRCNVNVTTVPGAGRPFGGGRGSGDSDDLGVSQLRYARGVITELAQQRL